MDITTDKAFDVLDELAEVYGAAEVLDALSKAMSRYELVNNLEWVCRMWDFEPECLEEE